MGVKSGLRWLCTQSWLRYSLVGGLSSLVLFAVSNILKVVGLNEQVCTAWGWFATLPVSYIGQRYFTFNRKARLHRLHLLFYAIAMLLILLSNQLATRLLVKLGQPFVFVSLGVVVTVTLVGFTLFRNWVFKPQPPSN